MDKVIFIAHGGKKLGMGHVIRSSSLAKQFFFNNYNVSFISKYGIGADYLREQNFKVLDFVEDESCKTGFNYGSEEELETECRSVFKLLTKEKPKVIVVDSYNISKDYFRELKKYCECLLYIDDLCAFDYNVDIIINGNISGTILPYKKGTTKLLLGLEYNLIRDEFKIANKRLVAIEPRQILITTGAADPYNVTEFFLEVITTIKNFSELSIKVVLGGAFYENNILNIETQFGKYPNIELIQKPQSMSKLMLASDIAITAGGSTIYELYACGVVPLAFIYADNQYDIVTESEKKKYLINLGYYNKLDRNVVKEQIEEICLNYSLRNEIVSTVQSVVDCKGTQRIAEEVNQYLYGY